MRVALYNSMCASYFGRLAQIITSFHMINVFGLQGTQLRQHPLATDDPYICESVKSSTLISCTNSTTFRALREPKFADHRSKFRLTFKLVYLGSILHATGNLTAEISDKFRKADRAWRSLRKFWSSAGTPRSFKITIYRAAVQSCLLSGAETIVLTAKWLAALEKKQTQWMRILMAGDACLKTASRINTTIRSSVPRTSEACNGGEIFHVQREILSTGFACFWTSFTL